MNNQIEDFIQKTEGEIKEIPTDIPYPFVYIRSVTNVELQNWVNSRVLHANKATDSDIVLALLRNDKYQKLGYIQLCPGTFRQLNALKDREIMIKSDENTEEPIAERVAMLFLLGD